MKRVLFFSNIRVPYRVRFFNELGKHCDLTVLYSSRGCQHRDKTWANSEESQFRTCYLRDFRWEIRKEYDAVILGGYNDPVQLMAMLVLKLLGKPYFLNFDGEPFLDGADWKAKCKRLLLSGAAGYLTAGETAVRSLQKAAGGKPVYAYPFSSLSVAELKKNRKTARNCNRNQTVLVVGQYFPYKGMDVALKAASMDLAHSYMFVGMGERTQDFLREHSLPANVQVIPFLSKKALENLYQTCALLVLPSRRECWGLVVNEAASFGMPVVSTWGSGAAVEFLGEAYPQYLAQPGDPEDLLRCIQRWFSSADKEAYSQFLLEKSQNYSIEASVQAHLQALEGENHGIHHRSHL